jgi:hypothetical protein
MRECRSYQFVALSLQASFSILNADLAPSRFHSSSTVHINDNRFSDVQHEGTRIFQSPLHIRNTKLSCCPKRTGSVRNSLDTELQWMVRAMEMEDSVHRQPLGFAEIKVARGMRRTKGDLWILAALQYILLHFLIARLISALAAAGLDGN